MSDKIKAIIESTVENKNGSAAVQEAVNQLLGEEIKPGDVVAPIDDPSYPFQGVTGKVKGMSAKGSGFVDVVFPDGTVVPMQSSLLLKR